MAKSPRLRVVIADDDERVRHDFRDLLLLEDDIDVVGLAVDGAAAVEVTQELSPDVVVMDIRMPRMDGVEATRLLQRTSARVLIVTTFDLDEYVLGAARAGAAGFLVKDQAPEQLADAIRTIGDGGALVSPRATARLLAEFVKADRDHERATAVLTKREVEIVQLMAQGRSNDEIALASFVSVGTVKTHVSSILSKLHLQSRIQIVVWAYEHGLAGR
jgi:DNA-binding NarL/FixJ family response regulator